MIQIYKNAKLNGKIQDFKVENGVFSKIGKLEEDGIDLKGQTVIPGLIDIHAHGCMGYDTMDGENLEKMSEYMLKNGITSWLPTTMTVDMDRVRNATKTIPNTPNGANVLGFHMEGPYISERYRGVQNIDYLRTPNLQEFNEIKNIKLITLAPELEGSMEFVKNCGAVVSIGHTDADYDTTIEAIKNGAKCLTHTFNAMPPVHHRNPGPIGAAIDKNIYVQVICDGFHIHKSVIKMLYRTFGANRMILISDCLRATGMPDGEYEFGGKTITVKNGIAKDKDGVIAGSTTNLMGCVKKAIEFGIPKNDAIKMASETPAKLLGIKKGKIKVGYDADFVVVDEFLSINKQVVKGAQFTGFTLT